MMSNNSNWEVNEKKNFGHFQGPFDLAVTRIQPVVASRFRSRVEQFNINLVNVEQHVENQADLSLDFGLLRDSLNTIFDDIVNSYGNDIKHTIAQVNITANYLKKRYIKSGLFRAGNAESVKNNLDFLVNEISVVSQSSEFNVFLHESFTLEIILTHDFVTGCQFNFDDVSISTPLYFFKENKNNVMACKTLFRKSKNETFLNLLKFGIVDVSNLVGDLDNNCVLISLAFAIILRQNVQCFNPAIKLVFKKYLHAPLHMIEDLGLCYLSNNDSMFSKITRFANDFQCNVLLYGKADPLNMNSETHLLCQFKCKHAVKFIPIKLMWLQKSADQGHVCNLTYVQHFIKGIRHRSKVFCQICCKEFATQNFRMHNCIFRKCKSCYLFLEREYVDLPYNAICIKDEKFSSSVICNKCNISFRSWTCKTEHDINVCKLLRLHQKCNTRYLRYDKHVCNTHFCRKCLSFHLSNVHNCSISSTRSSSINSSISSEFKQTFILIGQHTGGQTGVVTGHAEWLYLSIKQLNNNASKAYSSYPFENDMDARFVSMFNALFNQLLLKQSCRNALVLTDEDIFKEIVLLKFSDKPCTEPFISLMFVKKLVYKHITFKCYTNFVPLFDFQIAIKLGLNSALFLCSKDITLHALCSDKMIPINDDICQVESVVGTCKTEYSQLIKDRRSLLSSWPHGTHVSSRSLLYDIVSSRMELTAQSLIYCCQFVNNIHSNLGLSMLNTDMFYRYNSLISAGFETAIACLPQNSVSYVPTLYSESSILNVSSKAEIVLCQLFIQIHKEECGGTDDQCQIYCSFSTLGNYRVDGVKVNPDLVIICHRLCISKAFFIEGNFKYICKEHKQVDRPSYFNKYVNISQLQSDAQRKIGYFMSKAGHIKDYSIIPECCIRDTQSSMISDEVKLLITGITDDKLGKYNQRLSLSFTSFDKSAFDKLDYQACIMPQLIHTCLYYCDHNNTNSRILKYDLNSAYISTLLPPGPICLPSGGIQRLCGHDADKWFKCVTDSNSTFFAALKIRILERPTGLKLPFFAFKNASKTQPYTCLTFCSKCILKGCVDFCKHRVDKSFIVQCLLDDAIYAVKIGYKIQVLQVHYWKGIYVPRLQEFAQLLLNAKNDNNPMAKYLSKLISVQSFGRFALNIEKQYYRVKLVPNCLSLLHLIETKAIGHADFYTSLDGVVHCLATGKSSDSWALRKLAAKLKVNPLIFAAMSNAVRTKLHNDALLIMSSNFTKLIRLDVDCILFLLTDLNHYSRVKSIFNDAGSHFSYKLESDNINAVATFSKRSYGLKYSSNLFTIRVCGLSISFNDRFCNDYIFNIIFERFLNKLKETTDNKLRILFKSPPSIPTQLVCTNNMRYADSVPYGTKPQRLTTSCITK